MESLPMAPSGCSLDEDGLRRQLAGYRRAGRGAVVISRTRRRLVVELSEAVPDLLVEELIAVERECCPFFELDWQPSRRRLAVAVAGADREPALRDLGLALGADG